MEELRNKRISRKRAPGERPYAVITVIPVIKNVFKMMSKMRGYL